MVLYFCCFVHQNNAAPLLDNALSLELWYNALLSNLGVDCKEEKEEEEESNRYNEHLHLTLRTWFERLRLFSNNENVTDNQPSPESSLLLACNLETI